MSANNESLAIPTLYEAFIVWAKIGLLSFGGPAGQIALMHRMVVDEKNWLSEKDYLNALSFCMLLPGPEAMQLATYAGWRLHGVRGGLIAGLLFVIPGALVILILASIYSLYGDVPLMNAIFLGVKAAVIVVVIEALLRVAKKALLEPLHWLIAACAFTAIFLFNTPYPLIILTAAIVGYWHSRNASSGQVNTSGLAKLTPVTLSTVAIGLVIWFAPLLLLSALTEHKILVDIGWFFSKLAVVTFGGAYAVLAYLGQDVVTQFGWLTTGEMMDGLGLAETTPGPLILVTEFVGFIAAFREGGFWLGCAGAAVTLWVTFIPCFVWIFTGAPYIDWLSKNPRLRGALTAITAAVVGVILNLSIWFAMHVFFSSVEHHQNGVLNTWLPDWATLDWRVAVLTAVCAVLALGYNWGIGKILLLAAVAGIGIQFLLPLS